MIIINQGSITHNNNNNSINIVGNISNSNISIDSGKVTCGKIRSFNKDLTFDKNIEQIVIDSDVNVNISASNSSKATVHFYGQAGIAEEDIWFDARIANNELRVKLKFVDTCYDNNLKLNVSVPYKTFKAITIDTSDADVTLHEGVSMEYLYVKTISGDVKLHIYARKDITVNAATLSGSVSAELNNVNSVNLSTHSLFGTTKNSHKSGSGYMANVDISTTSGDITLY